MPTYAYACDSCGLAKDEWLKVSEALSVLACPSCGKASYRKQLTAPAFQLKGSGWYVTDFRNKETAKKSTAEADSKVDSKNTEAGAKSDASSDTASDSKAAPAKTESGASNNASSASASTPTPASSPATPSAKSS